MSTGEKRAAGAVVLYHPAVEMIRNLRSYIDYVHVLYAIDNSEEETPEFLKDLGSFDKIKYFPNHTNLGIARALNMAAFRALEEGYTWLLLMDQDSSFDDCQARSYFNAFLSSEELDDVAILSPKYQKPAEAVEGNPLWVERMTAWTSGSLLNLSAFCEIGPFEEKLFIDQVDHDYCLRARLKGYRILKSRQIYLNHSLGQKKRILVGGRPKEFSTHPPLRYYYMTRNNLYVWSKYSREFPSVIQQEKRFFLSKVVKSALWWEKDLRKAFHMARGAFDFLRGKYGR